jgi:hypothetical protein
MSIDLGESRSMRAKSNPARYRILDVHNTPFFLQEWPSRDTDMLPRP